MYYNSIQMSLFNYIKVCRLHRTINFSFMAFGALYSNHFVLNLDLLIKILMIYSIFGILLYGGIYSFNNYVDRFDDFKDKNKKNRLIPSGKLKPKNVFLLSSILIAISFVLGFVFLRDLILFQIYLLVTNIIYTTFLKYRNVYLSIITVATTGPTKFLLGYFAIQKNMTYEVLIISLVHYLCSVAYHARKFIYSGKLSKKMK